MPGVDVSDLLEVAVRPALRAMGESFATRAAEQLIIGTAAVESSLSKLKQYNNGPGVGLWQMEPFTFRDLISRCPRTVLASILAMSATHPIDPYECGWNLRLGAALCRLKYRDDPNPLPADGDVSSMAAYWKRRYNTHLGAGRAEHFERAWDEYVAHSAQRMWP